jgi:hypothetical protein
VVTAFDPLRGKGAALRTIEKEPRAHLTGAALSPDGATFSISTYDEAGAHIRLLSLAAVPDREIVVADWPDITGLDWSPQGNGIYVGSVSPQGGTLFYVDLKGNRQGLWQYNGSGEIWGVPPPDGHYLAIEASASNSNVWMLEGF